MVWACRGTIFRPFFNHFSSIPGGPPEKYPKQFFFYHFPRVGPVASRCIIQLPSAFPPPGLKWGSLVGWLISSSARIPPKFQHPVWALSRDYIHKLTQEIKKKSIKNPLKIHAKTIKNHGLGGLGGSWRGSGGYVGPKREKVRKNTTCLYALGPLKKSEKSICRRLRGIFFNLHLIFGVFLPTFLAMVF